MSLLNYFGPKKSKSSSAKKRKYDKDDNEEKDTSEAPSPKRQRLINKQKTSSSTTSNDSCESSDAISSAIPFPPNISNSKDKESKSSSLSMSSSKSILSESSTKSKSKSNSSSVTNDEFEGEEEDDDLTAQDKSKSRSKSKSKSKSKTKTKTKSKSISDDDSEEEKSLEAEDNDNDNDDDDDWETIRAKIDIKNLKFSQCDQLLHPSWKSQLQNEFTKSYWSTLRKKLDKEENKNAEIFPPVSQVFRAFELCPWNNLKVVILGQDPYHDNGQAEGLCFSVQKGIKLPSSLRNIYKEATSDVGFIHPKHGSLVDWGKQGVLLLNTALTVRAHNANSHAKFGWQDFTDAVIRKISRSHDGVVFIFWGKQAQKKSILIDKKKHRIIESAHPSGLSASRGFYGSKPFSKTNKYLKQLGKDPIDWQIEADD